MKYEYFPFTWNDDSLILVGLALIKKKVRQEKLGKFLDEAVLTYDPLGEIIKPTDAESMERWLTVFNEADVNMYCLRREYIEEVADKLYSTKGKLDYKKIRNTLNRQWDRLVKSLPIPLRKEIMRVQNVNLDDDFHSWNPHPLGRTINDSYISL